MEMVAPTFRRQRLLLGCPLPGDDLVLDPVVDVCGKDLSLQEIVFPVVRPVGYDCFGARLPDPRELIKLLGRGRSLFLLVRPAVAFRS